MGRKDNLEIFEDTQRLYSSNERLISVVKHSSAAQECFTGTGRHWYGPEHRIYQKPAKIIVILGDLSLGNGKETNEILCRLKGRLCLIRGNHDER